MSSVYVLEPPTKGKILFSTTLGDLDIELWPKEAPKAARNFVQLCLDGFYTNTIFHRIIKGFMVQGGDPTGTGTGGESIYGQPFADEFHSRLKFNHRGQVACANAGTPNSNNSQFFITLDRCDWLDKKNTIFGKVTGDTIYNLLKIGDVEVGDNDKPMHPPQILSVEILWNPFDDMVPSQPAALSPPKPDSASLAPTQVKQKVKETKKLNLLSFGEEMNDEEEDEDQDKGASDLSRISKNVKIRSSHDVLEDPRLLKSIDSVPTKTSKELKELEGIRVSVKNALTGRKERDKENLDQKYDDDVRGARKKKEKRDDDDDGDSMDDGDFDEKMRRMIMEKRKKLNIDNRQPPSKSLEAKERTVNKGMVTNIEEKKRVCDSHSDVDDDDNDDNDDGTDDEESDGEKKNIKSEKRAKIEKLNLKKTKKSVEMKSADSDLLSPLEQAREQIRRKRKSIAGREEQTLAKLATFHSKLSSSKLKTSMAEERNTNTEKQKHSKETDEDEGDDDWLTHRLKFDTAIKNDMARNDDPNQYVLYDPLVEKGKEKFNRMKAKMKKKSLEWAGRSLD